LTFLLWERGKTYRTPQGKKEKGISFSLPLIIGKEGETIPPPPLRKKENED